MVSLVFSKIPLLVLSADYAPMQTTAKAIQFYEAKTKEIGGNLKDLEGILQGKTNNLRVVEEGKRRT